tara:strand:- start:290 stop:496 length:207 start_codon:yes stop_codon:yes gene_type:complete
LGNLGIEEGSLLQFDSGGNPSFAFVVDIEGKDKGFVYPYYTLYWNTGERTRHDELEISNWLSTIEIIT